jgi:hypothetical protein
MKRTILTRSSSVMVLVAAGLAAIATGCSSSGGGSGKKPPEAEHMSKIPGFVNDYKSATKKQPASLEEVRDWAVKEGKAKEEDFVSTRDKELYLISFSGMGLMVCEQTGKNGKCYLLAMGGVSEVSAEDAKSRMGERKLGPGDRGPMKKGGG